MNIDGIEYTNMTARDLVGRIHWVRLGREQRIAHLHALKHALNRFGDVRIFTDREESDATDYRFEFSVDREESGALVTEFLTVIVSRESVAELIELAAA